MKHENLETCIIVEDDTLRVSEYENTDSEIVQFFKDFEREKLQRIFESVVKVGVVALKTIGTTERVDYIEKAFGEMQLKINKEIENTFGKQGSVDKIIDRFFGEGGTVESFMGKKNDDFVESVNGILGPEGGILKEVFDPNNQKSPLYVLKTEFSNAIGKLRTDLGIKEAVKEEQERGTRKGLLFQDETFLALSEIVKHIPTDSLRKVTTEPGNVINSKIGDYISNIENNGARLVIEAKESRYTVGKIEREMDEAMRNRNASYGIFLSKYVEDLDDSIGYFNEYHNGKYLIVAVSSKNEDVINETLLEIAYKWGRLRALQMIQSKKETKQIDITDKLNEIRGIITGVSSGFRQIKTYTSNIEDTVGHIRNEVSKIQNEVVEKLNEIQLEINKNK